MEEQVVVDSEQPVESAPPSDGVDFSKLAEEFESLGDVLPVGAEPVEPSPGQGGQVEVPSMPPQPQAPPVPKPEETVAVESPRQQPAPQPQPAPSPQLTDDEIRDRIMKARKEVVDFMAGRYKLSEEDAALLQTAPEQVLPRMAANLYADVYDAVFQTINAQLPQLIRGVLTQHESQRQFWATFFEKWPMLNKPEYREPIGRAIQLYRQLNPKASAQQMVDDVGAQVAIMVKAIPSPTVTQAERPAAPALSPQAAARPFVPASPGASSAPIQPSQVASNFFEELSREFEKIR